MKKNLLNLKSAVFALGIFFSTVASAQFTAVSSGDWSNSATWGGTAPTSTVSGQNITIPSGITVNLDQDVTFTGLVNTFQVNGTLNNTTSNGVFMTSGNLAGTGTVSIGKLKFSLLGATTFAGMLNVKTMINSVSTLAFTSMANVADTLYLESGNLSLNTNANLTMAAGSTVKVDNGSLLVNAGVFNSGNAYNVMYVGAAKTSSVELNSTTIQHVYVNLNSNSQSLTLGNNLIINGDLHVNSGRLDLNSKKLTLKGDLMMATGTMMHSDNLSSIEVMGTGTVSSAFMFVAGDAINDFTINRTGGGMVNLGSGLNLSGHLNLMEGTFNVQNNGTLTANATSVIHVEKGSLALSSGTFVGTAAYNVEYAGSNDVTSGIELTGTGLNNVMVNYATATNKAMLNANTTVHGKMEMMNGKLDINGKILMLNGTLQQSTHAWFVGSSTSELHLNLTSVTQDSLYFDNANAASQTLGKLKVNVAGGNAIVIASKLMIANELNFMSSRIELGNADLEIMPAASITGYDDTKYIITSDHSSGVLIQNVNSGSAYVTFPVGLMTDYSPAYVQQNSGGTSGNFSAKCHTLYTTAALKAVNRTWMVEGAGVTTVDANLKFGWKAASEMNSFSRANAYVSHYTSGSWDMTAATSATAGLNGTYELSRTGLTSLSPFAVVENGQPLKVSELTKIMGIDLYPNPSKDVLNVKVLNSSDEYQYELIDVTGRTVLTTSNTNSVNKFDVSGLGSGCYFVKITNLADNKTTTKRFIKQ